MLWSRWPLGTLTHHRSRGLTVASWSAALGGEEDRRRGAEAEEARARGRKGGGGFRQSAVAYATSYALISAGAAAGTLILPGAGTNWGGVVADAYVQLLK